MTSFYEQSSEEIGSAIFSYTSHTMGKQENRKKTDRKTGKERRKAEKTFRYIDSARAEPEMLPSIDTIWCIGRGGHWGTPMLDDRGCIIRPDFCTDCKIACDKHEKRLLQQAAESVEIDWDPDIIEFMEEQRRRNEQKWLRIEAMNRLLTEIQSRVYDLSLEYPADDYIAEIDDDFDY